MLPFPGIPYGFAPVWCFPFVEGSVFVFFVLCLIHAVKRDRSGMVYLLGGFVFGLLLEYFEVVTDSYYLWPFPHHAGQCSARPAIVGWYSVGHHHVHGADVQ